MSQSQSSFERARFCGAAIAIALLLAISPVGIAAAQTPTQWLSQYYEDAALGTTRDEAADDAYIAANFNPQEQANIEARVISLAGVEGRETRLDGLLNQLTALGAQAVQLFQDLQDGTLDAEVLDNYEEAAAPVLSLLAAVRADWTEDEWEDMTGADGDLSEFNQLEALIRTPTIKVDGEYALFDWGELIDSGVLELVGNDPGALTAEHISILGAPGVAAIISGLHAAGLVSDEHFAGYNAAVVTDRDGNPILPVMNQLEQEMEKEPKDLEAIATLIEEHGQDFRRVLATYMDSLPEGHPGRAEAMANLMQLELMTVMTQRGDDGELVLVKLNEFRELLQAVQSGKDENGELTERLIALYESDGGEIRAFLQQMIDALPEGTPEREQFVEALGTFDYISPFLERGADGRAPAQNPDQVSALNERFEDIDEIISDAIGSDGLTKQERLMLAEFLGERLGVDPETVQTMLNEVMARGGENVTPGLLADLVAELLNSPGLYANIDVIAGRSAIDPDLFTQQDDPSTDFTDITTGAAVTAASELVEVYFIPAGGIEGGLTVFINRSTGRVGAVGTVEGGPNLPSSYVGSFAGTLNQSSGEITGLFVGHSEALEDDDLDYRQSDGMGTDGRIITTLSIPASLFDGQIGDVTTTAILIDPTSIPLNQLEIEDTGDAGPAILLRQVPASQLEDMDRDFVGYAAGLLIDRDSGGLIDSGRTTDAGRDMMVRVNTDRNTASLDVGSIFAMAGPFEIGTIADRNVAVFGPQDFFISEIETPLTDPKFRSAQAGLVPGFSYVGWGRFRADLDNIDPGPPASRDQAIANISFVFGDSALSKAQLPTSATANYQGPIAGSGYDSSIGTDGHFDITGTVDLDVDFGGDTVDGTFAIGAVGNPMPPEILDVDNGVITPDGAIDFDLNGTGGFSGITGSGEGRFFGTPGVAEEVGGAFNAGDADVTVQGVFAGQKQ